ncbi:hypothetical protein RYZ20_00765 [Thioclava sp. A2]|uniref:hypothetical protein n=1 Tax=Thioclava sp. FCG-A2 TaxID=3080562 RepID=UPI0029536836|nr:hypothetical protein [Thioclava sp. A2]MDV7269427.1 hypothetical protein [Thioclava sp. A2]
MSTDTLAVIIGCAVGAGLMVVTLIGARQINRAPTPDIAKSLEDLKDAPVEALRKMQAGPKRRSSGHRTRGGRKSVALD